jgi:hypothetical protein
MWYGCSKQNKDAAPLTVTMPPAAFFVYERSSKIIRKVELKMKKYIPLDNADGFLRLHYQEENKYNTNVTL